MSAVQELETLIDEVAKDICDNYCKYPLMQWPTENYLTDDENSPCYRCLLNKL